MMQRQSRYPLQNVGMPRDCLQKIEYADFPLLVEGDYEIECFRVLQAAELVEVNFAQHPHGGAVEVATVVRITPLGRAAIQRWRREASSDGDGL